MSGKNVNTSRSGNPGHPWTRSLGWIKADAKEPCWGEEGKKSKESVPDLSEGRDRAENSRLNNLDQLSNNQEEGSERNLKQ